MILLEELFTLLATGEFSNISLNRTNTGSISESEYAKVIGHFNLGLIEIYKRFKLLNCELTLHVQPGVSIYKLQTDRIVTSTPTTSKYVVLNTGQTDINLIEIAGVYDNTGKELTINNRFSTPSIIQLTSDTLKIDHITEAMAIDVVYQAFPIKLELNDYFDPKTLVVPIDAVVIEALLYYIASRVYKPIGANNSTTSADKSASYQQQYELSCQKIEILGLGIQNCDRDNTFTTRGWV